MAISSSAGSARSPASTSSRSATPQAHPTAKTEAAREHGGKVAAYHDPREVFDDKGVDAVVVALPNHWHALATVWACQAGKDVYVEKPFSYDLWEGQQMVAAARKYGRMVQVGTQNRSSAFLRRVFDRLRGGELGAIRFAHALVYRPRDGIGTVDAPTPPPGTVNYDLWCGPAPKGPLSASSCTTSGTGSGTRATARWGTTASTSSTCAAWPWGRTGRPRVP